MTSLAYKRKLVKDSWADTGKKNRKGLIAILKKSSKARIFKFDEKTDLMNDSK